jgi:two-component system copper resistance phosphate regulon response regulator CusR
MRILLVEDDPRTAQILAKGLREHAYAVDVAADGERAVYQASISDFDAVLLDIGLPRQDGFAVCRQLRAAGLEIPILMLTARDAIEARVQGLDSGADDYLTKPFDFRELLARVRALLRRGHRPVTAPVLTVGPLSLDTRARQVRRNGRLLELTAREYALLEYLVLHANAVVGRAALTEHVWEAAHEPTSNAIDVCVQRLRRKIDRRGEPSLILTRRGEGYMLSAASTV